MKSLNKIAKWCSFYFWFFTIMAVYMLFCHRDYPGLDTPARVWTLILTALLFSLISYTLQKRNEENR